MYNKKKLSISILIIAIGLLSVLPLLVMLRAQTTEGQPKLNQSKKSDDQLINEYKATFPVVEYSYAAISDLSRKAKSKKYDNGMRVIDPNITASSREVAHLDWEVGVPALPVKQSQVILVGTVDQAAAFLSDDKSSVYSEFKVKVERVIKNDTAEPITPGDYVSGERRGGVVRFPTGFEKWFFINAQGMPALQKRYLFFLSNEFPGVATKSKDLNIVTAYELSEGKVFPLDNPAGGTHPIAKYKEKEASELFGDLDRELRSSRVMKEKEER